jgi:hypothetical protein
MEFWKPAQVLRVAGNNIIRAISAVMYAVLIVLHSNEGEGA